MNLQTSPQSREHLLMQDLERIEATISAASVLIRDLSPKRDALYIELDTLTRPVQSVPTLIRAPAFVYKGKTVHTAWRVDAYLALLKKLWIDFPERREAMAREMSAHGSSRTYISTDRSGLFKEKSEGWIAKFSQPLIDNWFVDTNLNRSRLRTLAAAAVRGSGLKWGSDAAIYV